MENKEKRKEIGREIDRGRREVGCVCVCVCVCEYINRCIINIVIRNYVITAQKISKYFVYHRPPLCLVNGEISVVT